MRDIPGDVRPRLGSEEESELEDRQAQHGNRAVSIGGILDDVYINVHGKLGSLLNMRTASSLKPKAEPKTMPRRASQPIANRT